MFGAIGGMITVLCVKMWEINRAANLEEGRRRKLPQEHDERVGQESEQIILNTAKSAIIDLLFMQKFYLFFSQLNGRPITTTIPLDWKRISENFRQFQFSFQHQCLVSKMWLFFTLFSIFY